MHLFDILQYSIFYILFKISVRAERSRSWRKREQKTAMFYYFNKFEYHSPNIKQQCSYSARKNLFFYYEKSETFFFWRKRNNQNRQASKLRTKNAFSIVMNWYLNCICGVSIRIMCLFSRKSYLERGKI